MSILVESLKRLYMNGQLTNERLNTMLAAKTISQDEYEYIVNN